MSSKFPPPTRVRTDALFSIVTLPDGKVSVQALFCEYCKEVLSYESVRKEHFSKNPACENFHRAQSVHNR